MKTFSHLKKFEKRENLVNGKADCNSSSALKIKF